VGILVAAALFTGPASSQSAESGEPEGFQLTPSVAWTHGDHRLALSGEARYRYEAWKARVPDYDGIAGLRARVGLTYAWRDRFRVFAQGQTAAVLGMSSDASGAAGLYRSNSNGGNDSDVVGVKLRQLYVDARLVSDLHARVGRQDINLGTLPGYSEPDWKFLKIKRTSQRLVGEVGWTNGARSFDAVSMRMKPFEGHHGYAFVAQPTTGVFEIENSYKTLDDVLIGGLQWTVERDTWIDNTELSAFFLGYSDDRNPNKVSGLFGDIEVYTLGASWIGVYPLGPGKFDVILWGALQFGEYHDMTTSGVRDLDHLAGAFLAEFGYQPDDCWSKPWLRAGVNFASGDDDPNDGDHNTFYNLLPTNHLYYGYADQLAFQNLIDLFVQLKLTPLPKLAIEMTFHQFWLHERDDGRYSGTGAFHRKSLGYSSSPSNGSNNVGQEIDVTLSYPIHRTTSVAVGYARMFGGGVFDPLSQEDTDWGFVQLQFSY
jgi:hypothetical protein